MKTTKYLLLVIAAHTFSAGGKAQKKMVAAIVKENFASVVPATKIKNLALPDRGFQDARAAKAIQKQSFFKLNKSVAASIIKEQPATLSLSFETDRQEQWILNLVSAADNMNQTIITTASGAKYEFANIKAAFYYGVVEGREENSLASISIFNNEITGIISSPEGNLVIGKLNGTEMHILYNDKNIQAKLPPGCFMPDLPLTDAERLAYASSNAANAARTVLNKCVRLYYETEYDIFQNKGSVTNVVNYVASVHNQVATLYLNEGIRTTLSQVKVWDITDPYTSTTTQGLLSQFQSNVFSLNGDLGQLLTFRGVGGGIAAGFNGLCNAVVSDKLSVSGIDPFFSTVPTFSWTVFVITHEFGHLFGSRHTHACVWNGNFTAIDGCAGFVEGGCSLPGNPVGGGTIMSYCHQQTVGVNFNLGFGTQPGDVIWNNVNGSSCLPVCCPGNINITGNYSAPLTESSTWINSSGTTTITSGATVRLDANPISGYILLNPGFSTAANVLFVAQAYNGCTPGAPARMANMENIPVFSKNETSAIPEQTGLYIYPNPASGIIQIRPANPGVQVHKFSIANAYGKVVIMANSSNHVEKIDISTLSPGLYIYTAYTSSGIVTGKFLKQ